MMVLGTWSVTWKEYTADTYTYGSSIRFCKDRSVEFENRMMPPGTVIKEWSSKTNFQTDKTEPALPIIDGEGRYEIVSDIDCEEGQNVLLRLLFYDRFGNEADSIAIWDKTATFQCPLRTYSYKLQLINGGLTRLVFHSVTIREISDDTDRYSSKTE